MNTPEDFAKAIADVLATAKAMGRGEKVTIQAPPPKRWWEHGVAISDLSRSSGWGVPGPHRGDRFAEPRD